MLDVDCISVCYGQIRALRRVSLKVPRGSVVSLVGANGAGKSTLMMTIAGALRPTEGRIAFDGRPLPAGPHRVVAAGISLVPERRRLYANLTVRENLLMGAHLRRDREGIHADIDRLCGLFPILKERFSQYAGTLSGGEQQMVAIARGLMSRPALLLMDEPSLGLAPLITRQVFSIIADLRRQGTTILLAEQNAHQSLEISDYAYVLESGEVVLEGSGQVLLNDVRMQESYLGIRKKNGRPVR
ncbi:MAG: ABC transporter ATP-binding protein [Clostridiales bacterium]|nr:ABC transporter ATP-binding protein [Clostridiales bacterium]